IYLLGVICLVLTALVFRPSPVAKEEPPAEAQYHHHGFGPIEPAEALDRAVAEETIALNRELSKGKMSGWMATPIAKRIAVDFRAKGWIVIEKPMSDDETSVRFAWPEKP